MGFDWHPAGGNLFFTDNGADWFGDDLPPDEFNCIPAASGSYNFGFPYCYGEQNDE